MRRFRSSTSWRQRSSQAVVVLGGYQGNKVPVCCLSMYLSFCIHACQCIYHETSSRPSWSRTELICSTQHLTLFGAIVRGFVSSLECSQVTLLTPAGFAELGRGPCEVTKDQVRKRRINMNFLVRLPLGPPQDVPGTNWIRPWDKPTLFQGQSYTMEAQFVPGTIPGTKGGLKSLCVKSLCAVFGGLQGYF